MPRALAFSLTSGVFTFFSPASVLFILQVVATCKPAWLPADYTGEAELGAIPEAPGPSDGAVAEAEGFGCRENHTHNQPWPITR
jgi:hypothetical protein